MPCGSLRLKHPFHLVRHVIHQPAPARLCPRKAQELAGAGHFAADGQALFQVQQAAGAKRALDGGFRP